MKRGAAKCSGFLERLGVRGALLDEALVSQVGKFALLEINTLVFIREDLGSKSVTKYHVLK